MEENYLFTSFHYLVSNDFELLKEREVKVFFIYQNKNVIKPIRIKKNKSHQEESYYINKAEKIIDRLIKSGELEEYSEQYLKKDKRKKVLACIIPLLCVGAIVGASVGTYFALKPTLQEVKVDVPETNGLVFSNQKAYVGQDYDTDISVNKMLTTSLLPDTLKTVTSGNRTILPTEYTYKVEDNKEKGSLHIPGKYIEGDVTIDLELVSPVPPTKYASIELSENSMKYGKLKYGDATGYTIDISNEIDKKEFEVEFVPETGYEDTKFVVAFADTNFTATYINKKLYVTGTEPLKDQDKLVVTLTEATLRDQYLTFTSLTDDSEIDISYSYGGTPSMGKKIPNLECSTDGGLTWIDITFKLPTESGGTAILVDDLDEGDTVMFRGDNPICFNYYINIAGEYNDFTFGNGTNDEFKVSGNIMSLLDKDDFATCDAIPIAGCFETLFKGSSISDASELILPAKTLTPFCYYEMFSGCTSLTKAPELPATELADRCYEQMFAGTSIATAPNLKAATLQPYCYCEMFVNTPIVNPPVIGVGAGTTAPDGCFYKMFQGCSSLTSTVELPALEFKTYSCYQMYLACSSLSTIYPIEYTNTTAIDDEYYAFASMFANAGLTITKSDAPQDDTIFHVGDYNNLNFCLGMFGGDVEMEKNKYYNFTTPWYKDTEYLEDLEPNDVTKVNPDGTIGEVKTLMVNGVEHKVRLIGVGEDYEDKAKTKPIHTTWEFVNLISDENGNSLATQWNDTNDTAGANYKYDESTIRNALNGENVDDVLWAERQETTWSNNYKCSVLDMLNEGNPGLVDVIKAPSKLININDDGWDEQTVKDKLFLLSPKEMGNTGESTEYEEPSTTAYSYYDGAENADRVKKQVNYNAYYEPFPPITIPFSSGSGQLYEGDVNNYAGYNPNISGYGGYSWLRSPSINDNGGAWRIFYDGSLHYGFYVYINAFAVAPAFCI